MKITENVLSIPPYISTTWKNVTSLHVREDKEKRGLFVLIVLLQNGAQAEVPHLTKKTIDEIFEAHARSAEDHSPLKGIGNPFTFSLPLKADGPIDSLGPLMEHNPEQANLPPIAPEVLDKIVTIARAFGLNDPSALPPPHEDCNCTYCQLARKMQGTEPLEEEVSEADLKFKNWEIKQTGDHLYKVTNPLDTNEYYTVFLGTPVGCTCGSKNCEHIHAVLSS